MRFLTLADLEVEGLRVLVRSDLNVPIENGRVADDFRLRAAVPTIDLLRRSGAVVIVCSHLGRPGGRIDESLRLAPVAAALAEAGGFPVMMAGDTVGPDAAALVRKARPGDVVLLENTRFHPGETTDDPGYAAALAGHAELFVLDAFGSAHRAHASTVGVASRLESAAGPLLVRELEAFRTLMDDPPRPFTVLLGGAKISDKLPLIRALLPRVDAMLVGGGMCFSLLAADGYEVGASLVEPDHLDSLAEILRGEVGDRLVLPLDIVAADRFAADATATTLDVTSMEEGLMGLDIGPRTAERFAEVVGGSGAVFWNGPMGVFEWPSFRSGTAARGGGGGRRRCVHGGGRRRLGGGAADARPGGRSRPSLDGRRRWPRAAAGSGTLPGVETLERWSR